MNFEKWFVSDLKQPLTVQELQGLLFTGDEDGNVIGFEVYDGGESVTLSGDCIGYIIRADGVTVTETGTIDGNKASIVLPSAAYYHEGAIDIVIKVTTNNNRVAVGAVHGYVQRSTTNAYADPSPAVPIPSVEELLEIIEQCEDATTAAQTAAQALNGMDATASTLTAGSSATVNVTTVDGHYRLAFGIPKGDKGDTGATGAQGIQGETGATGAQGEQGDPATITSQVNSYQASTNGVNVPTGEWSSTIPTVAQGSYLWIRTVLTWNGGSTTTLYSVSRMGVDGSGSVSSVNSISPDGNGNVELPYDLVPTEDSVFPCTSGGVYDALQNKQQILTFDTVPTAQSTNPVTSDGIYTAVSAKQDLLVWDSAPTASSQNAVRSGGVYTALDAKVNKSGDTMTGTLNASHVRIYDASYPMLAFISSASDTSALGAIYEDLTLRRLALRQRSTSGYTEDYYLPSNTATANTQYSIATSKQLIGTLTSVWTDAVNNAMLDITVLFTPSDHGDYMLYITIPKGLLTTAYRWFFGSQVLWSNASNITYYYQINATASAIRYQSLYRDGVDITNGATIRYIYR